MKKPFKPFYMPYGMSQEEYEHEVKLAEQRLAEWLAEKETSKQEESDKSIEKI